MKAYGSVAPGPHSTVDRGIPLPVHTDSGRDCLTDLARAHSRVSPIQIQPLSRAQTAALHERDNERAKPEARKSRTETPKRTPRPARPLLDVARLIGLYAEGLTVPAVATAVGCSDKTVYRILDDRGVPRREDRGRTGHNGPRKKPAPREASIDTPAILAAYQAGETAPVIAAAHGIAPCTVRRIAERAGLPKRDGRTGHSGGGNRRTDPPAFVAALTDLYTTQGHTIRETATLLDTTPQVILKALIRNGIERRPAQPRAAANNAAGLKDLMAVNGVTSADIRTWAADTGRTVAPNGIPPRHLVEAFMLLHRKPTNLRSV